MKPLKSIVSTIILLLFATACKKEEIPIDPYAWIDQYCNTYTARFHSTTTIYGKVKDTTLDVKVRVTNKRYMRCFANDTVLTPMINVAFDEPKGYPFGTQLFIKAVDWGVIMYNEVYYSGQIKGDSLILEQHEKYSPHGYTVSSLKGIKIR